MKILIICYSYSPDNSPRALRWTALAEEWARQGLEVHIVTGKTARQADQEIRNNVFVHRVGGIIFNTLMQWVVTESSTELQENQSHKSSERLSTPCMKNTFGIALRQILRIIHGLSWKQLYWPDANCFWIFPAARYARRLIKQFKFDVLVTVSHPFTVHVVGLLMQRNCEKMIWLADSGDPFAFSKGSPPNNFRLWNRLNFWIEKKLINSVKAFSVTTPETAELYRQHFPESVNKLIVVPPLIQPSFQKIRNYPKDVFADQDIILLFVGVFYKYIRPPEPLFELFEAVLKNSQEFQEKLRLHIIGPVDIVVAEALRRKPGLHGKVVLKGKMPHREAVEAMFAADCLVNIGNSTHYQLPSKVVEYMATGKPILNISSISNDSSSQVLRNYPASFFWELNKENDLNSLCHFIKSSRGQTLPFILRESLLAPFSLINVSARYLKVLNHLNLPSNS